MWTKRSLPVSAAVALTLLLIPSAPDVGSATQATRDAVGYPGSLASAVAPSPVEPLRASSRGDDRFRGRIVRIGPDLRERMTGVSWRRGCPVPLSNLRLLRVTHWGFDGRVRRGRLVVHADSARDILTVMRRLFHFRFPIRRMRLVDAYGADDRRSMRADNTSAFNCREISGRPGVWSQHAFGRAIDINPIENPYVYGSYVSPPGGRPFADRRPLRKGMITPRGNVVRIFGRAGWEWGGFWPGAQDYQHFSATGT